MLWEWIQRPHVARWWAHFMPPTYEANVTDWTAMVEGREPQRGYLMLIDGAPIGYIEGYRVSDEPTMSKALALSEDAVGADVYIAEPALTGHGYGPLLVGRFYLRMMDETGLDLGIIDPEVGHEHAIRAYEKAGFTYLKVVDNGGPRGQDHIMSARRADIEAALRAR
jgi:aminoglycoside 6'-N-acetyltransferase